MNKVKENTRTIVQAPASAGFGKVENNHKAADVIAGKADFDDVAYLDNKSNRDFTEDSVSLYIAECSKTPLLTSRDEKTLAGRIELSHYLSPVSYTHPEPTRPY